MLDGFIQDLRHGLRALGRARGLTVVVVATLGVTLGASVAVFSALNAVLLQALPFREPGRVVYLRFSEGDEARSCSPPTFLDLRRSGRTFESVSATMPWNANLTGTGEPERVRGLLVSADFFSTLGVTARSGRTFLPSEEQPGQDRVVVVSHKLWQRRFGGDPSLVGSSVRLDGESYLVLGIMPPGFHWGRGWGQEGAGDVWAPYTLGADRISEDNRGNEHLDVYTRLRPGFDLSAAQADLDSIVADLRARFPLRYREASGFRLSAVAVQEDMVGRLRPGLVLVFASVVSLLLLAAWNVAGLLLARSVSRRREISVRAALGATRLQLARHVLGEALALSLLAGGLGILLAAVACLVLDKTSPVALPRSGPIALSPPVAGFALLATFLVALVSGGLPALHVARGDLMTWLRGGVKVGGQTAFARRVLVVAQVSVALALLVGAGLLVRSLAELQKVALGFRTDNVLAARLQLSSSRYAEPLARVRLVEDVQARVSSSPGVRAVGAMTELPLSGESTGSSFFVEGRVRAPGEDLPHARLSSASPGYFDALGISPVRGRLFDSRDVATGPPVAIVSEALARRYYSNEDPIGRRIDYWTDPNDPHWHEIIGVVPDVRARGLDEEPGPQIYIPLAQRPENTVFFVARSSGDAMAVLPALHSAVRAADPELPLFDVTTMSRLALDDTRDRRVVSWALGGFAGAAVFLAALGLYGLLAQAVRERLPEVGLRMALGARRLDILHLFLAEGGRLLVWGLAFGVGVALAAGRLLRGLVFGVTTADPVTYVVVAVLLSVVALLASAVPAWRAARVDPLRALRLE